jgi:cytochrome d ubiquinol oxidase subunit II
VALTNIIQGVPIDEHKRYAGTFFTLLNPHALLGGVVSLLVFTLHGASFLALRTEGELQAQARQYARRLWWPTSLVTLAFAVYGYTQTTFFHGAGVVPGTLPLLAMAGFAASYVFIELAYDGWAFAATAFTIFTGALVAFQGLFPRVMPSSLNPAWDLTIYNASSSRLTLTVMLVVALVFVPVVLAYQAWSYWVFRKRVTRQAIVGGG